MRIVDPTGGTGMSRRRFVAPARGAVEPACFQHPLFAGYASFQDWMLAGQWPEIEALNARLALPGHCFQAQEPALLDDGLHYEVRIAGSGQIATRAQNWHDLFNAMVWIRHPALKLALNRQQCRHVQVLGGADRNRAQAALTQFDESGVIVRVSERGLLARWDAHDWPGLFDPAPWREGAIAVATVFGHALMEQALLPARRLVGKCLLVWTDDDAAAIDHVAEAIDSGTTLLDPLQLRPLPLAGIPGWHRQQTPAFYADADYFRPLREGRHYPPPLSP